MGKIGAEIFIPRLARFHCNWLNQKDVDKTLDFPNLVNFKVDYCDYHLKFGCASFQR